jgi:hypothetical protein
MRVWAVSYFLVAAVLLSTTHVASAQLANGKLCWVTMSGLGVCVPYVRPQAASAHHRRLPTEQRQ